MNPLPPIPAPGIGIPVAPELLAWLEFLGVVLAGGTLTFRALVLAPAARASGDTGAVAGRPESRSGPGSPGAVLALHAGLLAFLVGAYPIVGGGGLSNFTHALILPIRTGTHLGQAWTLMTFAWLGVLALLVQRVGHAAQTGAAPRRARGSCRWASPSASAGRAIPPRAGRSRWWPTTSTSSPARCGWGRWWRSRSSPGSCAPCPARHGRRSSARACCASRGLRFRPWSCSRSLALTSRCASCPLPRRSSPAATASRCSSRASSSIGALAVAGYHHRSVVPRIAAGAPIASIRRTLALEVSLVLVVLVLAATLSQTAPPS